MDETIDHIRNLVQIEQENDGKYKIHLPVLLYGGDWVSLELYKTKNNLFNITDGGIAIANAYSIVNGLDFTDCKKNLSSIAKEFSLKTTDSGELVLKDVSWDQLLSGLSYVAHASQKLSNTLIEKRMKGESERIKDLVSIKLKDIFRGEYKRKVVVDYEILGQSSKQYNIPFCIKGDVKQLLEPISNNSNSIATVHTKFFDIGLNKDYKRVAIIDSFDNWQAPDIELLKPVSDDIKTYDKLAA